MQEFWNLKLGKEATGEDQIRQALLEKKLELGIFLSYYFKKEGAVAENCELNGPITFSDGKSGNFTIDFDLVHFNACLNIHVDQKDSMEIKFEIDEALHEIKLIGPYWPEREMDEL